jgi:G6PDH family F420-dependent oxidoreductase
VTAFGYSLMCEEHHPNELLANAQRAEQAGFDFVTVSDHFHPWLSSHQHSPYESLDVITMLWDGRYHSFAGRHVTVQDARIFTLPDRPPPIHVAVSGPGSIAVAAEHGTGMVATEPDPGLVEDFERASGAQRPKIGQLAVCAGEDEAAARRLAHERWRFAAGGWKVQSELPNPVNFEAATAHVREEDVAEMVSCGPDPGVHAAAIERWVEAGFTHVAVVQIGPDKDAFLSMWERDLAPRLARA